MSWSRAAKEVFSSTPQYRPSACQCDADSVKPYVTKPGESLHVRALHIADGAWDAERGRALLTKVFLFNGPPQRSSRSLQGQVCQLLA